ncbi:hypothetical protein IQ276_018720 [Desmonostoc muscorum LEGE 12446]|uniref:Uncharacterized protein n=1 Tax=Desmonostoc muscorum LEGE 12446 TaxID=1828758 RepID=A0A8J6ZXJ5_DESMC|nr:hypothetical protein [Desmonostoc muscorum]MCF2148420.1 hypothetical protein [Desmonostoc muscorum LEGE 12446]
MIDIRNGNHNISHFSKQGRSLPQKNKFFFVVNHYLIIGERYFTQSGDRFD